MPEEPKTLPSDPVLTQIYPARWLMLAMYMVMVFLNGCIYALFSPLAHIFVKVYDVDVLTVNVNSLLMVVLYIPSNFFISNPFYKKLGFHWSVGIGCASICLCLWLRVLINQCFEMAMLGGLFFGLAQPLVLNGNAELATNWFGTHQRSIAMALASVIGLIGGGFGYVFHLFFISPNDENNHTQAKEHIFSFCLFAAICFTILLTIAVIVIREKPPLPPTPSASVVNSEPLCESMRALTKNRNYILIGNTTGFLYGCLCAFSQELAFIISPFDFDSEDGAILGAVFALVGIVGAAMTGFYVSKTKKYKVALITVCFGSMLSALLFTETLNIKSKGLTFICGGLLGVFIVSILAVAIDFGCEVTFPVPGNNSAGFQMAYSQVICTILIIMVSLMLSSEGKEGSKEKENSKVEALSASVLFVAFLAVGAICSVFVEEDLRKTEYDKDKSSIMMLASESE